MNVMDIVCGSEPYVINYRDMPNERQLRAQQLCWRFNQIDPADTETAQAILRELLGTADSERIGIKQTFRCDYGFNIHLHGYVLVNYNCVFLDTSPINIGAGTFIAPGCVLACAGHAVHPDQRDEGIQTSAPITIGERVWIGANVTVCGGVTIGDGSVIGAGSVVTRDVPAGVIAAGSPCRVLRPIDEDDRVVPLALGEDGLSS